MPTSIITATSTYSLPAHIGAVIIECWGAGGDGANGDGTVSGNGGGSGTYAKKRLMLTAGNFTAVVPVGDLAISDNDTFFAPLGSPVGSAYCAANGAYADGGGAGGVGDVVVNGTNGGSPVPDPDNENDFLFGGTGASSPFGGNGGIGGVVATDGDGALGGIPGGGGGGGSPNGSGGSGARGEIRVTYTAADAVVPATTSSCRVGSAFIAAKTNFKSEHIWSTVYETGFTLSSRVLVWNGFPLTLYDNGSSPYSLGIKKQSLFSVEGLTTNYKGSKIMLSSNNGSNFLQILPTAGSTTAVSSTTFCGSPIALNVDGSILLHAAADDIFDAEEHLYIGGIPVAVRRQGSRWYLVVTELL